MGFTFFVFGLSRSDFTLPVFDSSYLELSMLLQSIQTLDSISSIFSEACFGSLLLMLEYGKSGILTAASKPCTT